MALMDYTEKCVKDLGEVDLHYVLGCAGMDIQVKAIHMG